LVEPRSYEGPGQRSEGRGDFQEHSQPDIAEALFDLGRGGP